VVDNCSKKTITDKQRSWTRLTVFMLKQQTTPLEVTRALLDCARASCFRFGEDTAIVAVQHMLCQTIDLFRTIGQMGLDLRNVFCAGKVYSNNPTVICKLRRMGVNVIDTTVPKAGEFHRYFERDVQRLWNTAASALAKRRIRRILVLDDGGVCLTNVPQEILSRYDVCGVEQTSRGTFLMEQHPPRFAVISWARTAVKAEIGGPLFSHCLMDKVNSVFLRGQTLRAQRVGVIGLGSIGRSVATFAARQRNEVLFYDPHTDLHVPVDLRRRITRLNSLAELMAHSDYILGCSGRDPFRGRWPLEHRPNVKLFSGSGGDDEFGPIINDLKFKPGCEITRDTWDLTSPNGPSGPIQIAYLGYPYNFVSRGPEAVPSLIVQLESGGLLAALIQARLYLQHGERGHEQRGVERLSPQLQRFVYETWLQTLAEKGIKLTEVFALTPETLSAARDERWLADHTEPSPGEYYKPVRVIEELVNQFVCRAQVTKEKFQAVA
jgi:hypothetical protein